MQKTNSNIFCVHKFILQTPLPHSFLKGLTRTFIMEQAQKEGISILEKDLFLDLSSLEAAFLTGTAVGVVPIACNQTDGNLYTFQTDSITHFKHYIKKLCL